MTDSKNRGFCENKTMLFDTINIYKKILFLYFTNVKWIQIDSNLKFNLKISGSTVYKKKKKKKKKKNQFKDAALNFNY